MWCNEETSVASSSPQRKNQSCDQGGGAAGGGVESTYTKTTKLIFTWFTSKDTTEDVFLWNIYRMPRRNYTFWLTGINNYFIQGDQVNMAMLFLYLVKRDTSSDGYCTEAYTRVTLFNCYHKNTAMLNWSPCIKSTYVILGALPLLK